MGATARRFSSTVSVPRRGKTRSPSLVMKKACSVLEQAFWMKSGDYLSSRRLTASTFGVKELNFCVRNGNRWILFAIITAMVIYSALAGIHTFFSVPFALFSFRNLSPFPKINNYIANLYDFQESFISLLWARRNYRFSFINVKIS